MNSVVLGLNPATSVRFLDRLFHRVRHDISVKNHPSFEIARGSPGRLNQRAVRAQIAFLIGIKNGHQAHFGKIEPFAQ